MENPDIWLGAKEGKEVAMPKAAEVQVEQYKPITKKNIEIGKFSKDEALDYETDEKELVSGRMSEYISSMTVDVMDEDGNSIGNLIRLKDEDGIATYQATDIDGNELTLDEFDTKDEAIQALLDAHNKQAEKEFNKEQKRLAKEREKQAAKKQAQAPSGPVSAPALTESQKAGEKEMDALQDGDSITTKNPIRLLKGIYGKRNADGTIRSAHTGVDGIFSSITEKIAKRYEGEEGMVVFEVPAGVTVETIQIYKKKIGGDEGVSKLRPMETEAINNSKAQVVKLITFDSRGEEAQYIIKDPALQKLGYKPSEKAALSPEQELKNAFNKWREETGKMGIAPNWEKQAEADIKLFKALAEYLRKKLEKVAKKVEYDADAFAKSVKDAFSFDMFFEALGRTDEEIENREKDKERWRKFYNDIIEEKKEELKTAPVTPPTEKKEEGKKPVRELPETPEGQVVRAILGRSFQATTAQKVADAIVRNGMFRTPGNIEEAFEQGRKFVDDLGFEGAYELFQDLSTVFGEGIVLNEPTRLGIFSALTEDLQNEMFDVNSSEQKIKKAADRMAEVQAKASTLVSGAGQLLRMIRAIYDKNTVPYQYERRVKEWKALFPDSPITEEIEKKLRDAEAKYNDIYKKFVQLSEKQKEWEQSQAVSDIKEDIESEKKKSRKAPTSVLKKQAERVRKMGLSRPGFFSAATPASIVWDAAVETVALTLEAGGSVEIAIKKAIQGIKDSKWYKDLSDKNKKKAEASFVGHYADLIEEGVGMAELIKGNVVVPHSLIRYYVAEGMTDINEIADAILESLSEKHPELTQREVKDAITGYAKKVKKQTPDQIRDAINNLKREGKLQSQLEDLKQGIKKEKDPKQKKVLSQLADNLMKEIDKVHQEMFGHTPRQMSDEERLAAYKKRTAERIEELKRKISEGDFTKKQKRPPFDFDKEAEELEYEKYMLDEDWAEMLREEEKRRATTFTKIGQFLLNAWGVPRSVVVGIDFGVGAIQAGLTTFNSATQTAKAFAGAYKSIMSPTNYQRVDAALKSHPKYLEAKKAGLKFYSPKDPEVMKGDMASLSALQRAWNGFGQALLKPLGLAIGKDKEKQFYDFWKRINPLAALERSQAAFVNTLNFGLYLRGAEIAAQRGYTSMKPDNEKVFKQIADVTNTLSRKASLGGMEKNKTFMTAMNVLFFSAQNWASIIKIASPYTFLWFARKRAGANNWYQLSPAQQVYAEIMVKAVGTYLSTLILIKLLTGWEDDDMDDEERKKKGATTVNLTDPRRADYLKVRGPVETIDPFAGLAQEVILTYRIYQDMLGNRGFVSTKTGIESYLGEGTTPSALGLIGRQAEGKLSPTTRFLYRYRMSRPVKGQPSYIRKMYLTNEEIDMREEAQDLFTNITYETIKDVYTDYNVLPASFNSLLAIYGYGFTREEQFEEKAISRQIKETLGEGKKGQIYERAFKDYAKDGDVELAKKVFEKSIAGEEKIKKSIEIFKEMGKDNIQSRYKIDLEEKRDYEKFFTILKKGMPIDTKNMSKSQAERMAKINSLTKEQLDRIKSDYAVQYDELMSAKNVMGQMNVKNASDKPIDWDAKLKQINWVKKYRKVMGIK